jgi:hypothetical protein
MKSNPLGRLIFAPHYKTRTLSSQNDTTYRPYRSQAPNGQYDLALATFYRPVSIIPTRLLYASILPRGFR